MAFPWQGLPSKAGVGLSQTLDRETVSGLVSLSGFDHSVQGPHWPSTARNLIWDLNRQFNNNVLTKMYFKIENNAY